MGRLSILEDGPDPVVADQVYRRTNHGAPASHVYVQYWGKYSGWTLMSSRKWRRITKSLPGLWEDAYLCRGKNVTVKEVRDEEDYTTYVVEIEDGDRYVRYRNLPGYDAKGVVLEEMLGIDDYQRYTVIVCQATPIWDTVIRLCRKKGVKVTRTDDGWTFES